MALPILLLCVGVGILYFGAEWLVRGAARLADSLGISPIVVGLTVVSLGTSAPEMVVCVFATLEGRGDLAMGNVLGSNLANIGLVLGLTAIVRPLRLPGRVVVRELPIMLGVTLLAFPLLLDLRLDRLDGAVLLSILILYLFFIGWAAGEDDVVEEYRQMVEEETDETGRGSTPLRDLGLVVAGASGVVLGGHLIVENAGLLARTMGISEMVIGLTMVAIGTSLPELATSMVAAVRAESEIAVGNIVGSNIFNLSAVLGLTAVVRPLTVAASVLRVELPAVLVLSVLVLVIALSGRAIRRWEGGVLLAGYAGAGAWVLL